MERKARIILTKEQIENAIACYREHEPIRSIAARLGVTRQTIYAHVRKARAIRPVRLPKKCHQCATKILVQRWKLRRSAKHFCCKSCYYAWLGSSGYIESRKDRRAARAVVRELFPLEDQHVVHHIDSDQTHNDPINLMVFANHADHMRWHRLGGPKSGVRPLWNGARMQTVESGQVERPASG